MSQQLLPLVTIDDPLTCPRCKYIGDRSIDFDVEGACGDNVFCRQCNCEIEPSGRKHRWAKCCVNECPLFDPTDEKVK